jgi:hypothetical protein
MGGKATPRPYILADAHRSGSDATLCSRSKLVDSVGLGPKICGISTGAFTATAVSTLKPACPSWRYENDSRRTP